MSPGGLGLGRWRASRPRAASSGSSGVDSLLRHFLYRKKPATDAAMEKIVRAEEAEAAEVAAAAGEVILRQVENGFGWA